MTFPIRYAITGDGNIVNTISWEQQSSNTLSISIGSQSYAKMIIELPRISIHSPRAFVDGIHVPAQQITSNSKVRTLTVNFHKDSNKIETEDSTSSKWAFLSVK
jgi:hypothetical protein